MSRPLGVLVAAARVNLPPIMRPTLCRLFGGLFLLVVGLSSTVPAGATTIEPPTFSQLVANAERVVHARVAGVRYQPDVHEGREFVRTVVSFEVIESLDGQAPGERFELRFLGGEWGGRRLEIDGMPTFVTGTETVVFVTGNGRRACPLVGWNHGRFMVDRSVGNSTARVLRSDGRPLVRTEEVRLPLGQAAQTADGSSAAMSVRQLLDAVRTERQRRADDV